MAAPRLARADMAFMDAYAGEHYPVEVDVTTVADGVTTVELQLYCGCTDDFSAAWPHG